jgi:hypothetical protein
LISVGSLGLRQPLKTLRQAAQPERQRNHHHTEDKLLAADEPYHRQRARHRIKDKRHIENNRDDAADNQHPFVVSMLIWRATSTETRQNSADW